MHLLAYIFNRAFTTLSSRSVRYFGVIFTQIFGTFSHPLNITWMSLTCTDSEERALAMALVIMGANFAGIYGAQIFRQDDRPLYRRGFAVACAVLALGVVLAIWRLGEEVVGRRWGKGKQGRKRSEGEEGLVVPPAEDLPGAPMVVQEPDGVVRRTGAGGGKSEAVVLEEGAGWESRV